VTPVKPVYDFHQRWKQIVGRLNESNVDDLVIGVVGSGAGGFELITAMRHALPSRKAKCQWFLRAELPLKGRPEKVGQLAVKAAREQGIEVITGVDIISVQSGELSAADGRTFKLDEILWCTAAVGPNWAKRAGFTLDNRGFVSTNRYLQSVSHPFCFATGDIGTQAETPSVKAGVFAVRQAPYLFKNIKSYLLGRTLFPYKPQTDFLSLMATGGQRAIASKGPFALEANWVWRWKDHIDRTFMNRFIKLPPISMTKPAVLPREFQNSIGLSTDTPPMLCRGCGAKVSSHVLDRVLSKLKQLPNVNVLSGISEGTDTAVVNLPSNTLVQSVDHINAIVDDPYLLGRIAALHALSDVITIDAEPHSAQVFVSIPTASDAIVERDFYQTMSGVVAALNEERCSLVGGHTTQGGELSIGVVINATQSRDEDSNIGVDTHYEVKEKDALILTQGLGTGALFAGLMQQKSKGSDIAMALEQMQTSNRKAADMLRKFGAKSITDITGFGLLGHLTRMMRQPSINLGWELDLASVPFLLGAESLVKAGVRSSLYDSNAIFLDSVNVAEGVDRDVLSLLCDPQTSGGLLAIAPLEQAEAITAELRANGYTGSEMIGRVREVGSYSIN